MKSATIKYSISIILIMFSMNIFSQEKMNRPKGKRGEAKAFKLMALVVDQRSQAPLEYATVSVLNKKDSTLLTGGISDTEGKVSLDIRISRVLVKVEYLGYSEVTIDPQPFIKGAMIDMGVINLSANNTVLENVEIRAEKSESQFFLDKQVFNVGKDLANRGGSAEDILDNVPSVTVDIDGVVSLRGNTGVRMLIDGKPSGIFGRDNAGLKTIPANLIESIEVITNPSARYEAEGMAGIINIVLKKNKSNGFNGSFDLNLGYPLQTGIGANVNFRRKNFNWFFNYGLNYRESDGGGFNYQENLSNDLLSITDSKRDILRKSLSNNFRFGADYFINDKEQITAAFLFNKADEDNIYTLQYDDYFFDENQLLKLSREERDDQLTKDKLTSYSYRVDDEIEDEQNLEYSLNYTRTFTNKDHKLNTLIQFTDRTEVEGSDLTDNTFNAEDVLIIPLLQRSNNDEGNETWLFQTDYTHAFSKVHKWEAGIRSSWRDIRNDYIVETNTDDDWISLEQLTNDFLYSENIYAAYGIYGNKYNRTSFQAGLRSEYTDITTQLLRSEVNKNSRSFFGLFPSGHLNYSFSDANAVQLSYSRRIRRPRFWDLNPFFTFMDNRNFFSGNPNVNPQYTNSYEISSINYWNNFNFSSALFYRTTENSIQRISFVDNLDNSTITVPLNIGNIYDTGVDLNISYTAIKWLRLDGNFSLFNNRIEVEKAKVQDQVNNYFYNVRAFTGTTQDLEERFNYEVNNTDNLTWNGSLTARLSFWSSNLQLRGKYRGANDSPQGSNGQVASLDIGWSKDLTKNLTMTLSGRDVFNSRKRRRTIEFDDFYTDLEFQWRSRTYNVTFNYRINQNKKRSRPSGQFEGGEGF